MRSSSSTFTFLFACCCAQSFCWNRIMPQLSANPSALTWLCNSLSAGFASVWWSFLALSHSCFTHVWHRFLGCLSLLCRAFHAFSFTSSSSARDLQRRTWRLRCCLLEVVYQPYSRPCRESSSGSSYLCTCGVTTVFCVPLINS